MRFGSIAIIGMTICLISACSKEPPKCSDEATLSLVKSILVDIYVENNAGTAEEVREAVSVMKVTYPRAESFDEKIKKYQCEGKLEVPSSTVDGYSVPLKYESQLDDKDQHIVLLKGLLRDDLGNLARAARRSIDASKIIPSKVSEVLIDSAVVPVAEKIIEPAKFSEGEGVCKGLNMYDNDENVKCSTMRYEIADLALNSTYRKLMSTLDEPAQVSLKAAQISWIRQKEKDCPAEGEGFGGGLDKVLTAACFTKRTEERLTVLSAMQQ